MNKATEQRKVWREKRKEIEKILHPVPLVGNIEILHQHTRDYIVFSAWKGDDRISWNEVKILKSQIVEHPGISTKDIDWLAKEALSK